MRGIMTAEDNDDDGGDEGGDEETSSRRMRACATELYLALCSSCLVPLLIAAGSTITGIPAVIFKYQFRFVTPCITVILILIAYLLYVPALHTARPTTMETTKTSWWCTSTTVNLNRGAATRFACSLTIGYIYGSLEGALLVLWSQVRARAGENVSITSHMERESSHDMMDHDGEL